MDTGADKPSTPLMLSKIGGATLIMAGVVFMIGSGDALPGLALCFAGIGLLVVANQLTAKAPSSESETP